MPKQLISALCLLFSLIGYSSVVGQQPSGRRPKNQQTTRSHATTKSDRIARDKAAAYEALVEKLVMKAQDFTEQSGQTVMRPESVGRVIDASQALSAAGKESWSVLMRHLDDNRPSTASRQTIGPHDVSDKCYHILRSQVVSLPRGYPRSKLSPEGHLDQMFLPTLEQWLMARKDQPLEKMRVEVLEHLITLEKESPIGSAAMRAESLARLEPHLTLLKERLRKVSRQRESAN